MSGGRQRWSELAEELGLDFRPGVRGMLESKVAERILRQQGQDPEQLAAILDNGFLMAMLETVVEGVVVGSDAGYEVCVYGNSRRGSSGTDGVRSVHVQLFFPTSAELGLSIYREQFWSKVGKFLGAQDIQSGHAELDPLVMIKARDARRARRVVEEPAVQRALLDLFQHSDGFEVDDDGIEHRTPGCAFLEAEEVRDLADRMIGAAQAIHPVLGS